MRSIVYDISRSIFELIMNLLLEVKVYGRENLPEPPFIVTANHNSNMDPAIVGVACKKYQIDFMAKKEVFETPVLGGWTKKVGGIPVHRGDNSVRAIKESLRRIKQGRIVGLFPEGTRSVDGQLQEAKVGSGFLIKKAKVPIVPMYIYGSGKAWPKGGKLTPGNKVGAVIGEPIRPDEFPAKDDESKDVYSASASIVMNRIAHLKDLYESGNISN